MKTFKCNKCGEIDHVTVDGYGFGERVLEGVLFEIRFAKGAKKYKATVEASAKEYFSTLNEKMWLKQAEDYAKDADMASCPKCGEDIVMNEDLERPEAKPIETKLHSFGDILAGLGKAKAVDKDPNLRGDLEFLEDAGVPEIADSIREELGIKKSKKKDR